MMTTKKNGQLDTYFGHFLGPHVVCSGNVEVWDQTLGCPECGKELWTGKTSVLEFEAEHPFMFDEAHDDGDECPWADVTDVCNSSSPVGGWRYPWYKPLWWEGTKPYDWMVHPEHYTRFHSNTHFDVFTEHAFPEDMHTNHDPGDEC